MSFCDYTHQWLVLMIFSSQNNGIHLYYVLPSSTKYLILVFLLIIKPYVSY